MKNNIKRNMAIILTSILAVFTLNIKSASAEISNNYLQDSVYTEGNPAIGEYIGNPSLEEFVAEKQALAEQYYEAVCSGDIELIADTREKFTALESLHTSEKNSITNSGNRYYGDPPSSYTVSLTHSTQGAYNYCGPATAYMILRKIGVTGISQNSLAASLGTTSNGTAWYLTNGNSSSQFPMMTTLNSYQGYKYYIPSPMGAAGANPLSETQVKSYVMSATSYDNAIALCGISYAYGSSHLPSYPLYEVGHWLTCIGYNNYGNNIYVDDPASQYSSDFTSVPNKYFISSSTCTAFISPRGMIW